VVALLQIIQEQRTQIQQLKDEIARLKGHKTRPLIKPSTLEPPTPAAGAADSSRLDAPKRAKTAELIIHEEVPIAPANIPEGSKRNGCQTYVVQDLHLKPHNTRYVLERWRTPDGRELIGELPAAVRDGGHFGPVLKAIVLYQHHQQQVPQPRILTMLHDLGVDISSGQLNRLLQENHAAFHAEKEQLLAAGLAVSGYIHVDDTVARHQGRNGYTTHIGNEYFAWFASTESRSRLNFLQLLRGQAEDYWLTEEAFAWMQEQKLAPTIVQRLQAAAARTFADEAAWRQHLEGLGIVDERHQRIASEGALLGSVLAHGLRRDLVIVSDDAGQFDVWLHALCWVHAERNINKLVPVSDRQRADLEAVRGELWQLYADLKAYRLQPDPTHKATLAARFDALCQRPTCFALLRQALRRLQHNKGELLLVLERPDIPLHNNLSEQDIRDFVTKRKISGGTRSALGRRCRDTFLSLHKTCRKLGLSFWDYLRDRLAGLSQIPPLASLVRQRAADKAATRQAGFDNSQPMPAIATV